jgi:putative membrane protein
MQFPFFNYISYILPFTYMIHGQGAIVYGIATNTHVLQNSLFILQNIGILLIFPVIFYPIGLFMSHRRERELYYGTYRKYRLGGILKKMGYAKYCYETKKGTAVD